MKLALRSLVFLTVLAASFILLSPRVHAATLNVVAGTDAIEENSQCQLSEAIQNINDQAATNVDCGAGDGNNDTINLPVGTVTLSANLPEITRSMTIQGQGMGETVIDGDGMYAAFVSDEQVESVILTAFSLRAFTGGGVFTNGGEVSLHQLEFDGQNGDPNFGVIAVRQYIGNTAISMEDIYIHNVPVPDNGEGVLSIINGANAGSEGTMNLQLRDITISNVDASASDFGGTALTIRTGNPNATNALSTILSMQNITVDDVYASLEDRGARAVTISSMTNTSQSLTEGSVDNITLTGVFGGSTLYGGSLAFAVAGLTSSLSGDSTVNLSMSNSLLADNVESPETNRNCMLQDIGTIFGAQGTANLSLTSDGGNISDDASCNDYFTHPTDQTEVAGLADTLGTLSDNGGLVPTIPLLLGSPAIDAGVTVPGLTTDARGVSRPQCATFDSGAYEYNGTCPVPQQLTYPDPEKGTTVSLVLPNDVTAPSVSAVDPDTIPKDGENQFPAGLTTFQFTTTPGATKAVTLYYDLPGSPSDYTARKFKTNSQTFIDVPGATITREDYNGKSMLKLTYSITDGGILDQDGVANGTVIDPVGLATTSLADTGDSLYVYFASIMTLLGAGVWALRKVLQA